jgi:hypothetical protein
MAAALAHGVIGVDMNADHLAAWRLDIHGNSNHPNHTVQTRDLHRYLRWRNQNARHPDVLAAQRCERARVRSEKGIRWGGRPLAA